MLFSSIEFIFLFLPLFFLLYYSIKNMVYRNILLLGFSLFFYAWGEHIYLFLMLFTIVLNYGLARLIDRRIHPKQWLIVAVATNLALLGFFKYADFLIGLLNRLPGVSLPLLHIPLPLGISFFVFQTMSYVIDVYRGDTPVQKNVLYLGEYVASFPQLVAGPIVRYRTVADEIEDRHATLSDISNGLRRFIYGLSKKVLLANSFALICDTIMEGAPAQYGAVGAWVAILAYTLQIYFDFSGYSDMAIGMGWMMGFHFLENFNYPYVARSITDFWRRWHISLSTFFRDYLYIPLGGNRVRKSRWLLNLLIVWFLTGLWHGADFNFILWGLYYGLILVFEKLVWGKLLQKAPLVLQHLYTILLVMFGWVLFRLTSLPDIGIFFGTLFASHGAGQLSFFVENQLYQLRYMLILLLGILLSAPLGRWILDKLQGTFWGRVAMDIFALILLLLSISQLVVSSYNPFIYFRF